MAKLLAWLAFGALCCGMAIASCTASDGNANFDSTGGEPDGAGGDEPSGGGTNSTSGTKNNGGTTNDAGASSSEGGSGAASPSGGHGNGEAGRGTNAGDGGAMSSAGQPGGGGDATFGGMSGTDGGAPSGDAGAGGAGSSPTPCESIKHCEAGEVCVKATCDEQAEGVCAQASQAPVCGCDGLTYYDGELAAGAGVDVRNQGLCKGDTAIGCEGKCEGDNTACGRVELRAGNCETKVAGVCWQLPAACPQLDLTMYNLCESEKCLSLCEAVQEGAHAVPGGLVCAVN